MGFGSWDLGFHMLLAVESSSKSLSVALFQDNRLIEEIFTISEGRTHSEKLLPLVDQILRTQNLKINDIVSFAVAVGPGSFTALRVGMATVMGLACGIKAPIYPVSSLKALALGVIGEGIRIAPVFKSGRGRVYGALFERKKNELKEKIKEAVFEPADFIKCIKKTGQPVYFVGSGVELLGAKMKNHLPYVVPRASQVGFLALNEKIKPIQPDALRVRYLQEPDLGGNHSRP